MATAKKSGQVLDGSDIADLVHNKQVFSKFIDEKFHQLDQDHDGKLSVKELQPAVAEIGVALGLPAQGSSSDSDHIYSEVLSEFTHGKQEDVSKSEFQEVLSDILLGMAAGLKRDPIVILRIDGKDLSEFVNSSRFVPEAVAIFSQIEAGENESLRNCITKALEKLTVDHGMPPASDSWVFSDIIEPALQAHTALLNKTPPISKESFLGTLKKVAESIADHLRERPVIVAHSGNTFDGSGVKRLLSNKFETDKAVRFVPIVVTRAEPHNQVSCHWSYTGDSYLGEWHSGHSHGCGVQTCSDGSYYIGEFKCEVKHGFGCYYFRNSDRYAGEYFGDKMHGYGIYQFVNGHCYEGSWHEGREQGSGIYRFRDGESSCGEWDCGALRRRQPPLTPGILQNVQAARKATEKASVVPRGDERVNKAVISANRSVAAARVAAVKAIQNRMHGP